MVNIPLLRSHLLLHNRSLQVLCSNTLAMTDLNYVLCRFIIPLVINIVHLNVDSSVNYIIINLQVPKVSTVRQYLIKKFQPQIRTRFSEGVVA